MACDEKGLLGSPGVVKEVMVVRNRVVVGYWAGSLSFRRIRGCDVDMYGTAD